MKELNIFDKSTIYMHYYITHLGLKYYSVITNRDAKNWNEADVKLKHLELHYIWKDIHIDSFNDFCDNKHIDNGITNWYMKFKKEIKL